MASTLISKKGYLVSTDLGLFQVNISSVDGYDIEDLVRDRAMSQARAVQLLYLGKRINPQMPTTPRTLSSIWLNNKEELL